MLPHAADQAHSHASTISSTATELATAKAEVDTFYVLSLLYLIAPRSDAEKNCVPHRGAHHPGVSHSSEMMVACSVAMSAAFPVGVAMTEDIFVCAFEMHVIQL